MRYIQREAADQLNHELSLGATGEEQDWEVELSDDDRLEEFIAEYHRSERDDDRDFALTSLIVASFDGRCAGRLYDLEGEYFEIFEQYGNDMDAVYTPEEKALWEDVKEILDSNLPMYNQIIRYWSCAEDDGHPFASSLFYTTYYYRNKVVNWQAQDLRLRE